MKKNYLNLLLGILFIFLMTNLAIAEEIYKPQYPFATNDKIFEQIYGNIDCRNTENFGPFIDTQMDITKEGKFLDWIYTEGGYASKTIKCSDSTGITGCEYRLISSCPSVIWRGATPFYRLDGGNWIKADSNSYLKLSSGQQRNVEISCFTKDYIPTSGRAPQSDPTSATISLREAERKLYVYSNGYTIQGWLEGSTECKLTSQDSETLKKLQPTDKSLSGISYLRYGESKQIIIGWREAPSFGNINPLGKYNNQDILYKVFNGIFSITKISTVGGVTYWMQGSQLVSYGGQNSLCGGETGECSGNYVCENYKCVAKAVTCTDGSCSQWQKNQVISKDNLEEIGGKFYLVTKTCDENACIKIEKTEVKCTRNYCDRMMGGGYYCDYTTGCVKISALKPAPTGACTLKGGQWEVQNCPSGKQCCFEDKTDAYLGICRDSCIAVLAVASNDTGAEQRCIAQGGKWVPGKTIDTSPWYKAIPGVSWFVKTETTTTPGKCLISHISIFSILLILLGLGVLIFSIIKSQPIGAVFGGAIALVGAIWAIIAGMGIL